MFPQFLWQVAKISINVFICMTNDKKSQMDLFKDLLHINNDKKTSKCQFLLSFTQLSIWSNNFLSNGFAPTTCSGALKAFKHHKLPHISYSKNSFCSSWSNNLCDSQTRSFSKVHSRRKRDPIVKFGSLGHNSFEY